MTSITERGLASPTLITATAGVEPVSGLLWTGAADGVRTPLVLIGHGRKDSALNPLLAQRFIARGWNVLAIDAPGHGDRQTWNSSSWPERSVDESTAGWLAVMKAAREDVGIAPARLAYWGLSMGAALGISLVASDPRFSAAVLGCMHARWPDPAGERLRLDSASLALPVLFLANWEDTRAPRDRVLQLFDLIGSRDKRLLALPGDHMRIPPDALDYAEAFLARQFGQN